MLSNLLFFAHLGALTFWLGALVVMVWWTVAAMRAPNADQRSWAFAQLRNIGLWGLNPAAIIVLLSGIGMMVERSMLGGNHPLWFIIMERGGGTVSLISVVLVSWFGHRLQRVATSESSFPQQMQAARVYAGSLLFIGLSVMAVLFAVSMRLG